MIQFQEYSYQQEQGLEQDLIKRNIIDDFKLMTEEISFEFGKFDKMVQRRQPIHAAFQT